MGPRNFWHSGDVTANTYQRSGPPRPRPNYNLSFDFEISRDDTMTGNRSEAPARRKRKEPETRGHKIDAKAVREAVRVSEKERKHHESERRVAQAAREREVRTTKLEATLRGLDEAHRKNIADIESERAALDKRSQMEGERWEKQKARLEARLRRIRE